MRIHGLDSLFLVHGTPHFRGMRSKLHGFRVISREFSLRNRMLEPDVVVMLSPVENGGAVREKMAALGLKEDSGMKLKSA